MSALCYGNSLLCTTVCALGQKYLFPMSPLGNEKDCDSGIENCFIFDPYQLEHLLVQFIPSTSVEEPKGQRPESYSIYETDSLSHILPGPKKSQANKS